MAVNGGYRIDKGTRCNLSYITEAPTRDDGFQRRRPCMVVLYGESHRYGWLFTLSKEPSLLSLSKKEQISHFQPRETRQSSLLRLTDGNMVSKSGLCHLPLLYSAERQGQEKLTAWNLNCQVRLGDIGASNRQADRVRKIDVWCIKRPQDVICEYEISAVVVRVVVRLLRTRIIDAFLECELSYIPCIGCLIKLIVIGRL